MSERREGGLYWRLKELQNRLKIVKSREKEREIVNKMTKAELDSMHADYLSMLAKEALEKNNEQM